ncbi:hypothetical protein MSG28_008794 [Choristoneura fumiferana]|uniref:Uncharacterized protein n=1 Tax=Choristoneura fumiferana TaxID=7141 RepID=A0ACC0J857_CHOFU|nr:hypothetical protein MSG28_008794 [Choristoneura fumiferana]
MRPIWEDYGKETLNRTVNKLGSGFRITDNTPYIKLVLRNPRHNFKFIQDIIMAFKLTHRATALRVALVARTAMEAVTVATVRVVSGVMLASAVATAKVA